MINSRYLFIFSLLLLNNLNALDKQSYIDSIGNPSSKEEREAIALVVSGAQEIFVQLTVENIDKAGISLKPADQYYYDFCKHLELYQKASDADKTTQKTNMQRAIALCDVNTVYLGLEVIEKDNVRRVLPDFTSVVNRCIGHMRKTGDDALLRILLEQKKLDSDVPLIPFNSNQYGFLRFENGKFTTALVSPTRLGHLVFFSQTGFGFKIPSGTQGDREIAIANLFIDYKSNSQ